LSLLRPVGGKIPASIYGKTVDLMSWQTSPEDLVGPETIRMGTGRSEAIVGAFKVNNKLLLLLLSDFRKNIALG
jgi:hypothetical protein